MENNNLENLLKQYNQTHLLSTVEENTNSHYVTRLKEIDYTLLEQLYKRHLEKEKEMDKTTTEQVITPILSSFSKKDYSQDVYEDLFNSGLEKIAEGKVALLILAGGQGSRLGLNKAKGMYNIQMPSNSSLFEYLCQRFNKVQTLIKGKKKCLLLIMTSNENHNETVEYFKEHNYFEVDRDNIIFFPQDTIPALTLEGKVILKSKDEVFEAPNGNGGCFIAMKKHGVIEKCLSNGIEYIHVISIDNPLTKPLDPFFIGLTYWQNYSMAAKFVAKRDPSEPVGLFLNLNGKPIMMDYVDTPKHLCEQKNEQTGELVYKASNILNYLISVKLLNKILLDEEKYNQLINEFHISKKKIICYDSAKNEETTLTGLKFELFFNSIFQFADDKGLLLLEVNRNEEFAPVKNSDDAPNDNPRITRKMMSDLFKKWFINSGGSFNIKKESEEFLFELPFSYTYDGECVKPGEDIPKVVDVDKDKIFIK
jgi:UDP-N-acetylglucosamine/UDP-N-acetylgalactosamine diphosphorylase